MCPHVIACYICITRFHEVVEGLVQMLRPGVVCDGFFITRQNNGQMHHSRELARIPAVGSGDSIDDFHAGVMVPNTVQTYMLKQWPFLEQVDEPLRDGRRVRGQ